MKRINYRPICIAILLTCIANLLITVFTGSTTVSTSNDYNPKTLTTQRIQNKDYDGYDIYTLEPNYKGIIIWKEDEFVDFIRWEDKCKLQKIIKEDSGQ